MDATVIIPTFNRLWCLPEAVASCRSTIHRVEIIVVDDGSSDGTSDWLKSQDGLVVLWQEHWGKPRAVNHALARAQGKYVRFLDSDDMLVPSAADEQLRLALRTGDDICVAGYDEWHEDSGRKVPHVWRDCGDFLSQQLGECDSSHYSAYLFRRDFISQTEHRPEFALRDDRMFIIECAMNEPRVVIFPGSTLIHRHHVRGRIQFQPGTSAVVTNWQERAMYQQVARLLEARGLLSPRRARAIANNVWPLAQRIGSHDLREGQALMAWMWQLAPTFKIPPGALNNVYRIFGMRVGQVCRNVLRGLRNSLLSGQARRLAR